MLTIIAQTERIPRIGYMVHFSFDFFGSFLFTHNIITPEKYNGKLIIIANG